MNTKPRISLTHPSFLTVYQAMSGLQAIVDAAGFEPSLRHLLTLRASQINGCAYCIDMHTKDARAAGETEQRLYTLAVWRETPFFTDRERAALEWTEEITQISATDVPEDLYTRTRQHFTEEQIVYLTLAVVHINGWNRLAKAMHAPVGTYQPGQYHAREAAA